METSDDPNTLLAGLFSKGGGLLQGAGRDLFGGDERPPVATAEPETPTRTATAQPQLSEQARRNRRRRSASVLSQNFAPPTLGTGGQLGI